MSGDQHNFSTKKIKVLIKRSKVTTSGFNTHSLGNAFSPPTTSPRQTATERAIESSDLNCSVTKMTSQLGQLSSSTDIIIFSLWLSTVGSASMTLFTKDWQLRHNWVFTYLIILTTCLTL